MARIAIIGGGSMGEALLSGLLRAGRQVKDMVVAERVPERARYLSEAYSVLVTSVLDAAEHATYIIVAVKPSDVESVVGEIAEAAAKAESDSAEQVFVTIAAGVSTTFYESKLPAGSPVIRVMPNAPMLVGAGVSALAPGRFASDEQLKAVSALFESVGGVLTVPESQIDAVTAVSGSGPAYFFLMVEALVDAGVAIGPEPHRGHRAGVPDHGGFGGDVAGTAGPGPGTRRRRGHRGGRRHLCGPAPRDCDVPGRHHRRRPAGIGAWRFAGGRRRGRRRPRKHALSS